MKFKVNDHVRILKYSENSPDGYGRVCAVYKDKTYWITNLNSPYAGSISKVFNEKDLGKPS